MATSSGSLDTSANSHSLFTFSSHPFSDLLSDQPPHPRRLADRTGSGVPKFKSTPPPSLPISPPAVSPSSYFAIPPGLSPAELLDSPVLLSSSNILPSPTTGSFPAHAFNWNSNQSYGQNNNVKQEEEKIHSDFSFHPPATGWSYQGAVAKDSGDSKQSFSPPEVAAIQTAAAAKNTSSSNSGGYQSVREQRRAEDGYNWRKYGQKQVKGSENPRSYYKCTFPGCPTKKKVERSLLDGQVTEIVYKGSHNHPKPQSAATRRTSSSSAAANTASTITTTTATTSSIHSQDHSFGQIETPEHSSVSDDFDSHRSNNRSSIEIDEDEQPDAKRWRREGETINEGMTSSGSKTVREPRVVVQTTSDIDILDDGYRWRKYGQKVVKGNPNPRSYYKCTYNGCQVRKHVERASHDLRAVITTYEGKHNHDVPAARGSRAVVAAAAAPLARRPMAAEYQGSAEMVQEQGRFGFSALMGDPMGAYGGGGQSGESVFNRSTKDEPRDESFMESLLY